MMDQRSFSFGIHHDEQQGTRSQLFSGQAISQPFKHRSQPFDAIILANRTIRISMAKIAASLLLLHLHSDGATKTPAIVTLSLWPSISFLLFCHGAGPARAPTRRCPCSLCRRVLWPSLVARHPASTPVGTTDCRRTAMQPSTRASRKRLR